MSRSCAFGLQSPGLRRGLPPRRGVSPRLGDLRPGAPITKENEPYSQKRGYKPNKPKTSWIATVSDVYFLPTLLRFRAWWPHKGCLSPHSTILWSMVTSPSFLEPFAKPFPPLSIQIDCLWFANLITFVKRELLRIWTDSHPKWKDSNCFGGWEPAAVFSF